MSKNAPKRKPTAAKGGAGKGGQPPKPIPWPLVFLWVISMLFVFRTCGQQQPAGPVLTVDQNLAQLQTNAAAIKEGTANGFLSTISTQVSQQENALDDQVKARKLAIADSAAQKHDLDSKLYTAALLVADADLRAGEIANDYNKYQNGYQLLYTYKNKFGDTDLWQQSVQLTDQNGRKTETTGAALFDKSVEELSALSKKKLVYGAIPGYQLIDSLVALTGRIPSFSYWFAALLLAVAVRLVIWPLSQRQLMWGRQMSQLTPMLKEIKEQYKADPTLQQRKTMELYSQYGLHPLAGCWPALVQLPLFLAIYQCMLQYRFEFQKGTFLWINEHTSHLTHAVTAPNLGQKDTVLIIFYAVTLLISTLLTPVNDPTQVKQQRMIGIGVSLMFPFFMLTGAYPVPCAFVLYWTFTNILATGQSLRAYYLLPTPPLVKVNTPTGGVLPTERKKSWFERLQEQAQAQIEAKQQQTENQARKIAEESEKPATLQKPSNGKASNPIRPPSGGKQKPKRRTP